jgi:hypothetical protein
LLTDHKKRKERLSRVVRDIPYRCEFLFSAEQIQACVTLGKQATIPVGQRKSSDCTGQDG